MNIFSIKTLEQKLGIFHWNIGFIESSLNMILNSSSYRLPIQWLQHPYRDRFFADPFILKATDDIIEVLVEEFFYDKWKGNISLLTVSRKNYKLINRKTVLEKETHLSFPYIYKEGNQTYVIPENSQSGSLSIYEYNYNSQILENPQIMIQAPIVDPVIIKVCDLYYLLCTSLDFDKDKDLLLYYSEKLTGPYKPFLGNPMKQDITSARPGGGFYNLDSNFYRCTQNSKTGYGASINICKVESIEKNRFEEEKTSCIMPDSKYKYGLHTLDYKDGICVVDGLKYIYSPMLKIKRKLSFFK